MYRIIIRGCAGLGAAIAAVYITALSLAVEDGSGGIEVSYRVNSVAIAAISICVVLSAGGWVTREIVRHELARASEHTATLTAGRVAAILRDSVSDDLREQVETWLGRAHTHGMIAEAGARSNGGSVASISSRRDS